MKVWYTWVCLWLGFIFPGEVMPPIDALQNYKNVLILIHFFRVLFSQKNHIKIILKTTRRSDIFELCWSQRNVVYAKKYKYLLYLTSVLCSMQISKNLQLCSYFEIYLTWYNLWYIIFTYHRSFAFFILNKNQSLYCYPTMLKK